MIELNKGILRFGQRHIGGNAGGSKKETRANNEAITLIFMLTVAHFIVYTPYPILWALRASSGSIFSKDWSSFLIGARFRFWWINFLKHYKCVNFVFFSISKDRFEYGHSGKRLGFLFLFRSMLITIIVKNSCNKF